MSHAEEARGFWMKPLAAPLFDIVKAQTRVKYEQRSRGGAATALESSAKILTRRAISCR